MAKRGLALAASLALLVMAAVPVTARNVNADNLYSVHILASGPTPDGDLVNGWGIVASPTSPWWVSDNGTHKSTLYNGNTGAKNPNVIVTVPGGPTGIVFNGSTTDFKVQAATGDPTSARFIFATDDGQIAGWNGIGIAAISAATTPDAIYLGLAIGSSAGANYLYAANFPAARVDVFDATYRRSSICPAGTSSIRASRPATPRSGSRPSAARSSSPMPSRMPTATRSSHGEGLGYVSAFGMDGSFHGRVASAGELNAPWGLAMAPSDFGKFSGDLLVGNFGDGRIHAFRPTASGWEEHGLIKGTDHRPISIDGLWGIGFGNGATTGSGPSNTLFFAAGPKDETEGLFGSITAPAP